MSLNGRMEPNGRRQPGLLEDLPDEDLQVIAMRCFKILSERWEREVPEIVYECWEQLYQEAGQE